MTRVIVVDDHELFRLGVIDALESGGFEIVGEAATAGEGLRLVREQLPDVVLLDLGLPDRPGIEIVEEIARERLACRVVVVTVSEEDDSVLRALEAGATAYVVKGIERDELVHAVRAVAAGERYVSPALAADLLLRLAPGYAPASSVAALSDRERAVLDGIAHGKTNREIAGDLSLSEKTVKYYVTNVLVKLNVRNRVEAALVGRTALAARERPLSYISQGAAVYPARDAQDDAPRRRSEDRARAEDPGHARDP